MYMQSSTRCLAGASTLTALPSSARPRSAALHAVRSPFSTLGNVALRELDDLRTDVPPNLTDMELRAADEVSYVSRRRLDAVDFDPDEIDAEGLPLVYNEEALRSYWQGRPSELARRWASFVGISAPWLTRLANAFLQGRLQDEATQAALASDAVENFQRLGPTFVKIGQVASVRPDVLPPAVMRELTRLQDRIDTFPTADARAVVEEELGQPLDEVFSEWSEEPVGSASLAQVYRARLQSTGQEVAVKVQRPDALSTISKDLYVMLRAVGVYERIVKRFTAQTTDYKRLVSTFAEGLYTEMDFRNEALNAQRMAVLLQENDFGACDVVIPQPYMDLTTRRVLTMDWVGGVKLTALPPEEVQELIKVGQEAFLTQLLVVGFIHGDPHGGNLLKVTEGPDAGKLALLDFGLVAEIPPADREAMVSATIHLANRDWDSLVDDFVALGFLPASIDRGVVIPVMDRVLSPYLKGGGARAFNFQALSTDLLSVTLEIPFSVPPYMSLLARSIATLEGIALIGDPQYQMVTQAYPFVVRKVLRSDSSRSARLLQDLMLEPGRGTVRLTRLSALLNAALGYVAEQTDGFIDYDAIPDNGASLQELLGFLLTPQAVELRPLLINELVNGIDLLLRDRLRRAYAALGTMGPRLPFVGALPLPGPASLPVPVPGVGLLSAEDLVTVLAPELTQSEEIYLQSLSELLASVAGLDIKQADDLQVLLGAVLRPSDQASELASALQSLAASPQHASAAGEVAGAVVTQLMDRASVRLGVPVDTLFPMRATVLQALR